MGIAWKRVRATCAGAAFVMAGASGWGVATGGTVKGKVVCRALPSCRGAVVYVEKIPGRAWAPGLPATMDQVDLAFVPHVLPVTTGTTVTFPNSDDVRHNVFSASRAKRFNLGTYPRGVTKRLVFDVPGVVELLCNVHAEMSAYIIVADSPYAAVIQADGTYVFENVPAGTFNVVAWHERLSPRRQAVTVRDRESVALDFELH